MADIPLTPAQTVVQKDTPEAPLDQLPKYETRKTFTLRTPVTPPNSDKVLKEIVMRAINGLDILECDRPTYTTWQADAENPNKPPQMRVHRDMVAIRKYLTRLSDRPITDFYAIPGGDLNAIILWIIDEVATAGN